MSQGKPDAMTHPPLLAGPTDTSESNSLNPSDHVRMIVELLQPIGPDLARRWLAALLLVDRENREAVVESIERQIVAAYAPTVVAHAKPGDLAGGRSGPARAESAKK